MAEGRGVHCGSELAVVASTVVCMTSEAFISSSSDSGEHFAESTRALQQPWRKNSLPPVVSDLASHTATYDWTRRPPVQLRAGCPFVAQFVRIPSGRPAVSPACSGSAAERLFGFALRGPGSPFRLGVATVERVTMDQRFRASSLSDRLVRRRRRRLDHIWLLQSASRVQCRLCLVIWAAGQQHDATERGLNAVCLSMATRHPMAFSSGPTYIQFYISCFSRPTNRRKKRMPVADLQQTEPRAWSPRLCLASHSARALAHCFHPATVPPRTLSLRRLSSPQRTRMVAIVRRCPTVDGVRRDKNPDVRPDAQRKLRWRT